MSVWLRGSGNIFTWFEKCGVEISVTKAPTMINQFCDSSKICKLLRRYYLERCGLCVERDESRDTLSFRVGLVFNR